MKGRKSCVVEGRTFQRGSRGFRTKISNGCPLSAAPSESAPLIIVRSVICLNAETGNRGYSVSGASVATLWEYCQIMGIVWVEDSAGCAVWVHIRQVFALPHQLWARRGAATPQETTCTKTVLITKAPAEADKDLRKNIRQQNWQIN